MSIRAVIQRQGGPEVIDFVEDETASTPPGPGEVRMRHTAIGLNLIDTYHRAGVYPLKLPSGLGMEASGVVLDCGPGVEDFAPGDRVAYAGGALRAYAHERLIEASHLVRLPPDIGDEVAAAVLLKGMTVRYLLTRTFAVRAGHVLLVHAAAGGVGSLLVPWAKHLGARVIGCARGAEKQDAARASGCDHVLDAEHPDFVRQVRDLTGGVGVDVAYDSVGRATFDASLACLRRLGMLVSYGNASGKPPAIEPTRLAAMGIVVSHATDPRRLHRDATGTRCHGRRGLRRLAPRRDPGRHPAALPAARSPARPRGNGLAHVARTVRAAALTEQRGYRPLVLNSSSAAFIRSSENRLIMWFRPSCASSAFFSGA